MKIKYFIFTLLALAITIFVGSNVSAAVSAEGYPAIPDGNLAESYFIFETTSNEVILVVLELKLGTDDISPEYVRLTFDGSSIRLFNDYQYSSQSFYYFIYKLDNGSWTSSGSGSINGTQGKLINSSASSFLSIADNINAVDSDGNVVFPLPPTTPLEEIVVQEVETLQTKTIQTMKILALCGVGLLALLISLVILPKVLYRFL